MIHFVRVLLATVLLAPVALTAQDTTIAGVRFERREAMVPMRDGVRLFTVILAPRSPATPLPILLSRTPYGTDGWGGTANIAVGYKELIEDGYVFVFQDIRGQHRSEGVFIMNRPPRDRRDPRAVDEATDTWDTVEWMLRHVPGRTAESGCSGSRTRASS
jgi:putative CocE/NonD family hydrolase